MGSLGALALMLAFQSSPSGLQLTEGLQEGDTERVTVESVEARPVDIRTGEGVDLVIRLSLPQGSRIIPPDTLTYLSGARAMGSGEMDGPPSSGPELDGGTATLTYPLQLLRPGRLKLPPLRLQVQRGEAAGGGEWILLELGVLSVGPVIPAEIQDPVPTPPVLLSEREGSTGGLALLFVFMGIGLPILAWVGRQWAGRDPSAVATQTATSPRGRSPLSATETRKRLGELLAREMKGSGEHDTQWEEALLLYRSLLLAELGLGSRGHTTSEILSVLRETGGQEEALARTILEEGDRMRFEGSPVSPSRAGDALLWVSRWLEGTRA